MEGRIVAFLCCAFARCYIIIGFNCGIVEAFFSTDGQRLFLGQTTFVMLIIGVLSGWVAIYTGELAYDIEVRKICDPEVLQEHQ